MTEQETRTTYRVACQSCGGAIEAGQPVVRVQVGVLHFSAHPHALVGRRTSDDYFHRGCDVAVPST